MTLEPELVRALVAELRHPTPRYVPPSDPPASLLWVCEHCAEVWELERGTPAPRDDHGRVVCAACRRAGAELGLPSVLVSA